MRLSSPVATAEAPVEPKLRHPVHAAVTCHVQGKFEPAPNSQLVKSSPQIILYDLLGGSDHFGDIPISQTLPNKGSDLKSL